MSESLSEKTKKATAWSSLSEIMAKLISPILNIILARLLTPEDFGAVATITMIITFAEVFTDAGFQKFIVQHNFCTNEELDKNTNVAFWTNFVMSVTIVTFIVIFRHQIASLVGSVNLGDGIALSSLTIILVAFSSIQTARFRRDLNFKPLFFARIGSSLIPLAVTLPLAFIFKNFWAIVIGNIAVNLFNSVILTVKSSWKPKLYFNFAVFKKMFSFSAWTLLESVSIWLTTNVDIFIVGKTLDDYHLGIYKTSISTVNSYVGIITAAIIPVLFSALSRYQNDKKNFMKTFWNFQKYVAIVVLPMSVGIFIFRDFVTYVLLGSQWQEAADFIGLWGLMSGITILFGNFASEVYRSKGNPKLSLLSQIIHIIFLIPAILISLNFSFSTMYTIRALMRIQFVILNLILLCVVYKFSLSKMIKNIMPALVSTGVMAIIGLFLSGLFVTFCWQFLCVIVCVFAYFITLITAFPKFRNELFEFPEIKRIVGKFKR